MVGSNRNGFYLLKTERKFVSQVPISPEPVSFETFEDSMGINGEGIEVILHLVDQLHGVRRSLIDLRSSIQADAR